MKGKNHKQVLSKRWYGFGKEKHYWEVTDYSTCETFTGGFAHTSIYLGFWEIRIIPHERFIELEEIKLRQDPDYIEAEKEVEMFLEQC